MSRADSPQSPTRHGTRGAVKNKSQKQSAARHGAAGPSFPRRPHGIRTLKKILLATRRKQARPRRGRPKKFDLHVGTATPEEVERAKALDWRSELFRPLKLSFPSRSAIFAAARAGKRASKLLVVARGTTPEKVIEMPGMMKLSKKQPKPKRGRAVAWGIGVPKQFVICRPGLPPMTVTEKEPVGRPRGKGRPRRTPWFKKEFASHKLSGCFQKAGVTDGEQRVLFCFWRHEQRWREKEQQQQTKKKRAGGHNPWALQRAVARDLRVSEGYVSRTLSRVYKKMKKHLHVFLPRPA